MTGISESLKAALADRYLIERELGRGGMATVFLARDIRHQRRVAIKVLDPSVATLVSTERFLQEIRVMATLQHPHILPLFDSGEAAGELFYVMPFAEGETLRERLKRERKLPVEEATRITREVASALDFAHRHGVVHRDIKPENILLTDGHALVADFGIARALLADASAARHLTATGMAVGTPGYMSPEQAGGDTSLDGRADIYALGAVTHEMLAGTPPFSGPTPQAVLARSLTETPPSLAELRRGLDPRISSAVLKALATEPADRFAAANDFARAIETVPANPTRMPARPVLAVVAAVLVVIAAVGLWMSRNDATPASAAHTVRVAVLPFRETGASGNPGFVEGLADAVRTDLGTLPDVDVIAGTSINALGDSAHSPTYVAAQLGATHILSGSIQWSGDAQNGVRVRVVPEVVDVSHDAGRAVSGTPIEVRLDDLFETQSRVSLAIAGSLGVTLSAEAATRLGRPLTRNRRAYEAYLRALRSDEQIPLLQEAVSLDSMFGAAWSLLGQDASLSYQGSFDPALAELAQRATARAMALDSTSAEAHLGRSLYLRHVPRDFAGAVRHGLTAMRLAPGSAEIRHFTAAALFNAGRFPEALELARRGVELDPRSASAHGRVATLLIWNRDFAAAERATAQAMKISSRRLSFINFDSLALTVMRGDLPATQSFIASLPDSAARASTVELISRDWFLWWPLDASNRRLALQSHRRAASPAHYYVMAAADAWQRGDTRTQRAYADSGIRAARERLATLPGEERLRLLLAFALGFSGHGADAVLQADSASATRSAWKDGFVGAGLSIQAAEVLALAGRPERAIALADSLLKVPGLLTAAWLRADPFFEPLRSDPHFRTLADLR